MVLLDLGLIIHRRGVGECLVPGDQMYHTSCSIKNGLVVTSDTRAWELSVIVLQCSTRRE